jgi:hypothetical protein
MDKISPHNLIVAQDEARLGGQERARPNRARFGLGDQTSGLFGYSVEYLNSGIALSSSLVALNTA